MQNDGKGQIYYGLHFYPGVAEYQEPQKESYRVFLNENTLRKMDPTFAGRPVFVQHVDGVDDNIDVLKTEADGWVVESFYNQADGKHWVKFIVVSEKGERAIRNGMRLSNCYIPKAFASGGLWNGVSYAKEITGGEYEHLAIVPNPRYEESVIMTPEEFKKHNEDSIVELKRLSNEGKDKGMKLQFFKRSKVENAIDLEQMSVVLPKTNREVTIAQLVSDADRVKNDDPVLDPGGVASIKKAFGNEGLADPAHKVKMHDGSYCNVAELVEKHKALHDELEGMKAKKEGGEDQDADYMEKENDEDQDKEYSDKGAEVDMASKDKMNKDEKDMPKGKTPSGVTTNKEDDVKAKEHDEEKPVDDAKKKNEIEAAREKAKEKAERLRNAHLNAEEPVHIDLSADKVARGKTRYGS